MKKTKIWLFIAGVLLIAFGVVCLINPNVTLKSTAIALGIIALMTGAAKMLFTFKTQKFLPNSGTRMLTSLLDIVLGVFILFTTDKTAALLPMLFAVWVTVQGISIVVQSFDYRNKARYPYWWGILILGICATALGILGLWKIEISARTLSVLIGLAVIANGMAHLVAVSGIGGFQRALKSLRS